MATAFTTWAALRTALLDAIANHVAGSPCVAEYYKGSRRVRYTNYDELIALYEKTFVLENIENAGDPSSMVSYSRHRRF